MLTLALMCRTYKYGHKHPSQSLLFNLLDHRLFSRSCSFAHYCQSIDVSDRAHSGSCQPRQAKEWADSAKSHN